MPAETPRKTFYLVDAHAYLHRAYHALPPLNTSRGEPVGALYGFARALLAIARKEKPDYLAVCFDAPGPTFRHEAYAAYKATRKPTEEDLKVQFGLARELVAVLGFKGVELPGFEADDLMATLARLGRERGLAVVLVSGDKDALQLVREGVSVLNEAKGQRLDTPAVEAKLGVGPRQVADYLALVGDSSDNVPGVPGIGPVGAVKLLKRYGTLESLLEAAKAGSEDVPKKALEALRACREAALKSRALVRLDEKAPISLLPEECRVELAMTPRLKETLERFEFHTLLRELGGEPSASAPVPEGASLPKARSLAAKDWLKAARGAEGVAAWLAPAAQADLLEGESQALALCLEDGRFAEWSQTEALSDSALAALLKGGMTFVGHDWKAAAPRLRRIGMDIPGKAEDAMLAAYALNSGKGRYDLAALLMERLGAREPESVSERAAALWPLWRALKVELEARGALELYALEIEVSRVLADMEAAGVALDVPYLESLRSEFARRGEDLKRELDALAGTPMNPNSPKQVAEVLFSSLKLPVLHKTQKGGVSTDEETLRSLAGLHPLPAKLIEYREIAKLKSTYVDALLLKRDPASGRIHTHFNQAATATGRLSSSEPNLQNIPVRTALGQKIRGAFTAPEGWRLVSADYSQIELRVLAHLCGDAQLRAAFANGDDVHRRTASEVFAVEPSRVDAELRRRAKAVNFGIVYGQTPHGLSQELGIPYAEAKGLIGRYFERYAGVKGWVEAAVAEARRSGQARTALGRVRPLPELASKNPALRAFGERAAVNTAIQGTAADIIKLAMARIGRELPGTGFKGRLLLQVHDELLLEAPAGEAERLARWIRSVMEEALPLSVPLTVDLKIGPNWRDMEALR